MQIAPNRKMRQASRKVGRLSHFCCKLDAWGLQTFAIPSIPSLVKICDAFQITLSEFFAKAEGSESKRSWHPQYPSPVQHPGWQIHGGCDLRLPPSSFLPAKAAGLCHAPGRILFCRHHPGSQNRLLRRLEAPKAPIPLRHRLQHLSPRPQRTPAAVRSLRNPARCFCGQMRSTADESRSDFWISLWLF